MDINNYYRFIDEVNRRELPMKEIMERLGIDSYTKQKYLTKGKEEGLIPNEKYTCRKVKNYYYHAKHQKWVVRKVVRGTDTYFGEYETEEMARRVVELLTENNWDKSVLRAIQKRVVVECTE